MDWSTGVENVIKNALLIGNHKVAIDCSLKIGRVFEAFLIAKSHQSENFKL
jgi:hypothetical protein